MSMSRIPWPRLSSDEMEHLAAMLLCAKYPTAVHFTPGPDGGIDIYVPDGDSGRKVFQVKHFPDSNASSQFRQTKRSIARVAATAEREGWTITEWRLVIPRDPTPVYRTKIAAEIAAAGTLCGRGWGSRRSTFSPRTTRGWSTTTSTAAKTDSPNN